MADIIAFGFIQHGSAYVVCVCIGFTKALNVFLKYLNTVTLSMHFLLLLLLSVFKTCKI